jgi:hypothetical protein
VTSSGRSAPGWIEVFVDRNETTVEHILVLFRVAFPSVDPEDPAFSDA